MRAAVGRASASAVGTHRTRFYVNTQNVGLHVLREHAEISETGHVLRDLVRRVLAQAVLGLERKLGRARAALGRGSFLLRRQVELLALLLFREAAAAVGRARAFAVRGTPAAGVPASEHRD